MAHDSDTTGGRQAEDEARVLADSVDAAAEDLRLNGPVPPAELARILEEIEAEWAAESG